MRYRPLGASAAVVSAISLNLAPDASRRRPSDWVPFIHAALELGISAFEIGADDPVVVDGLSQALSAVDRALVFVAWRLDGDVAPESLSLRVKAAVARTGLAYLDALVLEPPGSAARSGEIFAALQAIKATGAARLAGLSGEGERLDDPIGSGVFDMLITNLSLASGAREHDRLRAAGARGMGVVGRRPHHGPIADCGDYGWTAQEVSLAYALAEPSLSSVQLEAGSIDELERMAAAAERETPPGLAARIDVARFAHADMETERRA